MQLFGFNISRKSDSKIEEKSFFTRYEEFNGNILDGKAIVRNNSTFYRMYRNNVDIRRAITEKQETSMKDGYEVRKKLADGSEEVVETPVFDQVMEASGGIHYMKDKIIASLDLFGNAYIRRVYNVRGVMKYEVLDARQVTIFTDSDLVPTKYLYRNPAKKGATDTYEADTIIHVKSNDDLDNPLFGISPLESIVIDVLGDEEASLMNHAYFKNDGIPSALYIFKEGVTDEVKQQTIDQIKKSLEGGHNKHKSLASSAIEDIKPIDRSIKDMSFKEQRTLTTVKVCVALGVPRSILGYIDDVNYSNGDVQYKKFIENTIRPLEERLEEIFTLMLHDFPEYKGLEFEVNDEHIDDFQQRSKLAIDNVNSGLWTRNEARDYIGYERFDTDLADEITVPANARLLEDLVNGTTIPPTSPTDVPGQQQTGKSIKVKLSQLSNE